MANEVRVLVKADAKNAIKGLDDVEHKASKLGSAFGTMGKAAAIGFAAVGTAAVGAGVGLFKLGQSFDDAFDTIAVGTDATGQNLKDLEKTFKTVFTSVPTDMGKASKAVADLNTRTGATGPTLEKLTATMLEMTRITGGDLETNITSVTRLMGDWGIKNEAGAATMDKLFTASQATGIGIDKLSSQMVQFGAPLRQLGFGFDTSVALLAKFEKEGVNAELVMGSLRIALGKMAREGEPAEETLNRTIEAIKNAGSTSEANALALELFGARAGPDMAAAIREGRFAVDDLVAMMGDTEGAILQTADSTADFGEKFSLMKARVMVGLEPMATATLDAMTRMADYLLKNGPVWIAWYQENIKPTVDQIVVGLTQFARDASQAIQQFVIFATPYLVAFAQEARKQFLQFKAYYESDLKPAFDNIVIAVKYVVDKFKENWDSIKPVITAVAQIVNTQLGVVRDVIAMIVDILQGDWKGAWENAKQIVTGMLQGIKDNFDLFWSAMKAFIAIALAFGKDLAQGLFDGITEIWTRWIVPFFQNLPRHIGDFFAGAAGWLYDIGKAIITGLWDGMKAAWGEVSGWVGGLGGKIKSLKGPLEKDLVLLKEEGQAIMKGLQSGMEAGFVPAGASLKAMAATLKQIAEKEAAAIGASLYGGIAAVGLITGGGGKGEPAMVGGTTGGNAPSGAYGQNLVWDEENKVWTYPWLVGGAFGQRDSSGAVIQQPFGGSNQPITVNVQIDGETIATAVAMQQARAY